jgi:DNA-binding transcriptional LysR family regulator
MPNRRLALTPEALQMMDTIARSGSFAAAARELGKVPSALTYSVRQLEESLDVLLFDRRSRQAQFTAAGLELLNEGRRLLQQMDAVANRVQRVATGWETQLTVTVDNIIAPGAIFDLMEAFYALQVEAVHAAPEGESAASRRGPPPTRLKLRNEVMSGTLETLLHGQADLVIGVPGEAAPSADIQCALLGEMELWLVVAPHHPLAAEPDPVSPATLAQHRVVAIADTASRSTPMTVGVLPGQDVLTVPSLAAKLEAQLRGLGCGGIPEALARRHVEAGRLVRKIPEVPRPAFQMHYAWRRSAQPGEALRWWLAQLERPATRRALLEQHVGLVL